MAQLILLFQINKPVQQSVFAWFIIYVKDSLLSKMCFSYVYVPYNNRPYQCEVCHLRDIFYISHWRDIIAPQRS